MGGWLSKNVYNKDKITKMWFEAKSILSEKWDTLRRDYGGKCEKYCWIGVVTSATRQKGFDKDIAPRTKCDTHDWSARECKLKCRRKCNLKYSSPLSKQKPTVTLLLNSSHCFNLHHTPTSPNGVAAIFLLPIEETVVSHAFRSKKE